MTEDQIRKLEKSESSLRKTGNLLGTSGNRIWLWRHGVAKLTPAELVVLEKFLTSKLRERVQALGELTR